MTPVVLLVFSAIHHLMYPALIDFPRKQNTKPFQKYAIKTLMKEYATADEAQPTKSSFE
jgi:hypothetical protein